MGTENRKQQRKLMKLKTASLKRSIKGSIFGHNDQRKKKTQLTNFRNERGDASLQIT